MSCKLVPYLLLFVLTFASSALAERNLYISDPGFPQIFKLDLDQPDTQALALFDAGQLTDVRAMAVDEINRKLYWVSPQDATVYRANLDGSQLEPVAIVGGFPESLAIDQIAGKLYIGAATSPSLYRINTTANLNNPQKEILINSGSQAAPQSLNLNFIDRKIYWTDQSVQQIRRANFDGTNRENLSPIPSSGFSIGLALVPLANFLFYGDIDPIQGPGISSLDINPANFPNFPHDFIISNSSGGIPHSIALDLANLEILWIGGNTVVKSDLADEIPVVQHIVELDTPNSLAVDLPCSGFSQDSDIDSIPDCADLCPDDQFKVEPNVCGCHLYEFDAGSAGISCLTSPLSCTSDFDLDSVPDCADLCPSDPLKLIPGVCGCGEIDFIFDDGSFLCFDFPVLTFDTVIDEAPEVIVQDNDVTVMLKQFSEVIDKKTKKFIANFLVRANAKSKNTAKLKFRYDVRLTQISGKGVKQKNISQKLSKKNQVTYKNLKPGSYKVSYRVQILKKTKVVKNTNFSPAATFSIKK